MSIELDPKFDKMGSRAVRLGGQEFLVAPVPFRQIIALANLYPKIKGINADNLSGEDLEMLVEVVRRGLLKAHPAVTDDDLLDLPIRVPELLSAFHIIFEQAGAQEVIAPGEAEASRSTPSTGNGSSPGSSSTSPAGLETRS